MSSDVTRVEAEGGKRHVAELPGHCRPDLVTELRRVARAVDTARHGNHDRRARGARSLATSCARYFVSSYTERKPEEIADVRLVDDRAVGVPEDVDGRDVDDPRHGGVNGGVDHALGAGDVRIAHSRGLDGSDSHLVHGGCVDDEIASVERPGRNLAEIADHQLAAQLGQRAGPSGRGTSATTSLPRSRKSSARRPPRIPSHRNEDPHPMQPTRAPVLS
jgi:hypothetical protein